MATESILVTGGAGFIGSSLVESLVAQGKQVVILDNFDLFYDRAEKLRNISAFVSSPGCTLVEGDIRDADTVASIFRTHPVSLVVHLAARAGVRPSIADPIGYFDVNVHGTLVLLQAMRDHQVRKLVYASSSSVYGNNIKIPYSEIDNVDFPISPYAASKKAGELATYTFHHLYDVDVINLRFFTVYGPRQRPDLAIHKFFKAIYSGVPIDIYGDGSTSRDYTYIDDIVDGIHRSVGYLLAHNQVYEIINLGNSHPVQLGALTELIEQTTGKQFKRNHLPMQEGDVNRTFADIGKAKSLLGYHPATSIQQGLEQFRYWYEKH